MIKPWLFEFFVAPGPPGTAVTPQAATEHYNWYLDLWQKAEGCGFEGIFFSEHHFGPAYSPSPNLIIATMAPRTRTLRLGVMGMVVPYYEPWRVAEEIAMLDHLTGGRLEIGTSAGIPNEMAMVGLSVAEARARNDEALAIIDAALLTGKVTHQGKYWSFENLPIVPRPLQQPSPTRWTTVVSIEFREKGGAARLTHRDVVPFGRAGEGHLRRLPRRGGPRRQSVRPRAARAAPHRDHRRPRSGRPGGRRDHGQGALANRGRRSARDARARSRCAGSVA